MRILEADLKDKAAEEQYDRGEYLRAAQLRLESLRIKDAELGPDSIEAAYTRMHLGHALYKCGQLDQAEKVLRQAMAVRDKKDPMGVDAAIARDELARVLVAKGDRAGAQQLRLGRENSLSCGNYDVSSASKILGYILLSAI